jgi:hypothetical protein
MRRRLRIKKRLQLNRLKALKPFARRGRRASQTDNYNVYLISAGLTDPFAG